MDRDLFPGFSTRRLNTAGVEVFARVGGSGPPLLLTHGYPQTHACWHKVASQLAEDYSVVVCDLRGYGLSGTPDELPDSAQYAKRPMAMDLMKAMSELGFDRFFICGHDRGARAAYRLALDHPERVAGLAVLNILPTFEMWLRLQDNEYAMKAFRFFLLAQPAPFPENLIKAGGLGYLRATLADWTKRKDLTAFDPGALAAYEAAYLQDKTVTASCGDYRAGWTVDRFHDQEDIDSGRKISCPTLLIWGAGEYFDLTSVVGAWKKITSSITVQTIDCGHFPHEEAPGETYQALRKFFVSLEGASIPTGTEAKKGELR